MHFYNLYRVNLFKSSMAMTSVCQGIDVLLPIYFFIPSICPAHGCLTGKNTFSQYEMYLFKDKLQDLIGLRL